MSEPWEDFQQSSTATVEAGPWEDFKGPWEDFQSDAPSASVRAIVPPPGQMEYGTAPMGRLEQEQEQRRQELLRRGQESEGAAQEVMGALTAPLLTLSPENAARLMPALSLLGDKQGAGTAEALAEIASGLTSPVGLATIPAAIIAPGQTIGVVAGLSAKEAGIEAGETSVALQTGDIKGAFKHGTKALFSGAQAALGPVVGGRAAAPRSTIELAQRYRIKRFEESAGALDRLSKEMETGPIRLPSPEQTAREALRPSPEAISTPEALRRPNEQQLSEAPTAEQVGEMGPPASVPREIVMQADAALEAYLLAKQRKAELGAGGKLETSGETFSGMDPGFLKSAEQRIANRVDALDPVTVQPEITTSTPLRDVEQIVRERLEQRDWVNAVATLGQTSATTSAKIVNKLLGVGKESVPLKAGERMIFDQIWEQALEKSGAKPSVKKPPEQMTPAEFRQARVADPIRNAAISVEGKIYEAGSHPEAFDKAVESLNRDDFEPSASLFLTRSGKILSHQDGLDWATGTHQTLIERKISNRKPVSAQAVDQYKIKLPKDYIKQGELYVAQNPPDLIQRLESLRTPLTPGVGANPFPEIAKAVWNTSLDIAIAAVKAGQHIKVGIDAAVSHIKKNAQGFDEAKVRAYLSDVLMRESTPIKERAEVLVDKAVPQIKPEAPPVLNEATRPFRVTSLYSEPILERVGQLGKGAVSKAVTKESLEIVDNAKRIIGDLSTDGGLDAAKKAAGSMRGGTVWMQGLRNITPRAAVGRLHEALGARVRTGNFEHVPEGVRPLAELLWTANLNIGKLAERASPGFKASGEAQRMLTSYGMDIVRRGGGKAWQAWAEGLAKANKIPIDKVKVFLRRWKAEMDQPGWDTAKIDKISQDFKRQFPNVVTHVKPLAGWHEVVHSSPFRYLEQSSQRTAHAVAFREVYPLIQDAETGQWGSSGKLEATRKIVMSEMETDKHGAELDNLMRALQGHPIDTFSQWWNAPDAPIGATVRALNDAAQPIFSLMLSATSFRNIGETLSGGAQIFMGYRRTFISALEERKAYSDLERSGMVNRAMLDFSFDPTQPGRSASRITSNLIRRSFAENISNEFQEFTGAAAARVMANEIRQGRLPPGDQQRVVSTMRAMGIAYDDAVAGAAGRNEAAVRQFETKAAEFLYGGNRATAEASTLGASRAFTALFKWHSYPMTKMRQTSALINNILESVQRKDAAQAWDNAKLLGKHMGGTALAGALTTGIMALIYEGNYGAGIRANEAQEDFPEFLKDSFVMAMGGPIQVASKIMEEGGDVNSWLAGLLNASAPVGVANDLSHAVLGTGTYEGTSPTQRLGQFLESKTPFARAVRRGMAAFGLSQENPELDAAIRGFKRWQRNKFGFTKFESHLVEDYDNKVFRGHMKRAVDALKRGRTEDYEAEIEKAVELEGVSAKKIRASARGRKIMTRPKGERLTDEDEEELQKLIGDRGIEAIQEFDAMLSHL